MQLVSRGRVVLVGAAALALIAPPVSSVSAGEEPPPLALVAGTRSVTIERPKGESIFELDLGAHLVAGSSPFEIRARRTSYRKPVVATQVITEADGTKTRRTLPDGLATLAGLEDFLRVDIRNKAGRLVHSQKHDWCPNSYDAGVRTRPDAPSTSGYPQLCVTHPFGLSAVYGVRPAGRWVPACSTPGSCFRRVPTRRRCGSPRPTAVRSVSPGARRASTWR